MRKSSTSYCPGAGAPRSGGPGAFLAQHPSLTLALLTPAVLSIHGYHPLADDGAIYVAGIRKLADPSLYRPDAVFVSSHTHFSIFAHALALLVVATHIPLAILLLALHTASIYLFLLGSRRVAVKVFDRPSARWGAVLLAAVCFTLPVAGTSLFVMDPYVTARSFSTPLSLFALSACVEESWGKAALWLASAAILHPLMAGYAAIFMAMLALAGRRKWRSMGVGCGLGIALCAAIFLATRHTPADLAYSRAALSRSYFFLSTWAWYEYPGLALPLLLLAAGAWRTRAATPAGRLSLAAAVTGGCALLVAVCFVHRSGSLALARLQVLRSFHMIYVVGILLAGGLVGGFAQRRLRPAALLYLLAALLMYSGQRLTYPASNHVEWPWLQPRNPWRQAFLWIRAGAPRDAVFAMDADYIESRGEDAQGFRAAAERSAVADWFKDGGIASIFPEAAGPWWRQVQATEGLNAADDAERAARLRPFAASWILLPVSARTALLCPYVNTAVRVCRLPP